MYAIFKKELKTYLYSPIAYVLIGLFILVVGVFFYMMNLSPQSADYPSTMSSVSFILVIIIPVLTMKILAEDRKNGTEVLLITSPVKLTDVVFGKYLALLSIFLIMTALTLVYPVVLFAFGKPVLAQIIGSYLGFIFFGAALISLGVFASSLTENQVIAVVISGVSMLIIWFIEPLGNRIGGWESVVLKWFSLPSRFDEFATGVLNLGSIVYYVSFIAVFLFLTVRIIEKRRWSQG